MNKEFTDKLASAGGKFIALFVVAAIWAFVVFIGLLILFGIKSVIGMF